MLESLLLGRVEGGRVVPLHRAIDVAVLMYVVLVLLARDGYHVLSLILLVEVGILNNVMLVQILK